MTQPLFDWLPPSVTQHVALALVHFLWQGTLVALVLAVILRLLRDRTTNDKTGAADRSSPGSTTTRADARYVIACFGLGVMAALPVVNLLAIDRPAPPFDTPSGRMGGQWLDASAAHRPDPQATSMFDRRPTIVVQPAIEAPLADEADTIAAAATAGQARRERLGPSGPPNVASPWIPSAGRLALRGFFWIWLAGVSLLSAWHVIGWALSQRLRHGGKTAPDEILALAGRIARRLGIRRAVAVRQTLRTSAPVVIGWIKPALLLPATVLTGLPPHELEAVLAHELAHVRRHDYLVNLVQAVVETLLFYHPAVWWVSWQIRSEREFCADDLAMRACQGREVYVRSLIAVAESSRWSASPAVAATGGSLLARVRRILHLAEEPSASPRWAQRSALAGMLAALCLGVALMAAAQNRPADDTEAQEEVVDSLPAAGEREEIPGNEFRPVNSERKPAVNELRPVDSERKPAAAAEEVRFRIERTQTTAPEWQAMIARCEDLPRIRSGHGQVTLMRVLLEEGDPDALVQLTGANVLLPERRSGGGLYLQIRNGGFVLLDHINSTRRREGKDPVAIGTFTHYWATIWVTVPPRGTLGVLGDVILAPVPKEQMGRIVATLDSAPDELLITNQLRVGPFVVGGPYGETFYFDSDRLACTGRIAPGSYKILLPDFDMQKSRWTVDVSPGELTRLRFLARSQRDVEKTEEAHRPETELETRLFEARKPRDVKGYGASSSGVNRLDNEGFAPLHRAALGGDQARAIELLESGADVDVRQAKFQGTPLQYAAAGGHAEVVRTLLDRQAKIDACDTFGRTPLMWAAMKGETNVARLLVDRNANVNARTPTGWTPLHYAVDEGHAETAQLLIDRGADVAARNSLGKTPRELAGDLRLRWPEPAMPERLPDPQRPASPDRPAESQEPEPRVMQSRPILAPAEAPGPPPELPEHVSTVLRWLPADTELLIVAKDFELPYPNAREGLVFPMRAARMLAVEPLPAPAHYGLSGRRVRWAIHAGRNCEIVSAFGTVRQEGASIIHFEEELPEAKLRELRDWLLGAAESVRTVAGHDVYAFPPDRDAMEPVFELKPWQGEYIVLASAEMMITASSDAYLSELLTRRAVPPRETALPLSLPEWKYLDPDADVWLLRHLPSQNPNVRLRVPEGKRKLRGLVWMLRGEKKIAFRATYLPMPNHQKEVEDLVRRWFTHPGETEIPEELAAMLEFTTAPDGSVTLAISGGTGAPAEFDPRRFLAEEFQPSDARTRLVAFFGFGLHASQGLWE